MDPAADLTVLVWRRAPGGGVALQVADGKSWRLPRRSEVGLRCSPIDGPIGWLTLAPADFTLARTHRWIPISGAGDDVQRAHGQAGAAVVVWRRTADGPEVLLLHRAGFADDADFAWMGPGGALDPGETVLDCAERELLEETGLDLPLGRTHGDVSGGASFVCEWTGQEIVLSAEHDRYVWASFDDAIGMSTPGPVVDTLLVARRSMT